MYVWEFRAITMQLDSQTQNQSFFSFPIAKMLIANIFVIVLFICLYLFVGCLAGSYGTIISCLVRI